MKKILICLLGIVALTAAAQSVTLDECVAMARANYPLIRKYELVKRTEGIDLADIRKAWFPRIGVYAQGTVQNHVPGFPDEMEGMLSAAGVDMKGLRNDQYKVGVDLNQTLWDGGKAKADREVARADAEAQRAANDVELYAVEERVHDLYFAVLLLEAQAEQAAQTERLLQANLERLRAMLAHGTAMQCDVDVVEAECLTVRQNMVRLRGDAGAYRLVLGVFTGTSPENRTLECPSDEMPADLQPERPELARFDAELQRIDQRRRQVNVGTMPRIGLFTQAFYGYPGFDYFRSMQSRDWSFNIMAGIKLSWNLDAFYTKRNRLSRLSLADNDIAVSRDVFLFNNRLASVRQQGEIRQRRAVLEEDARIVALRTSVRKAAESRLANGVIDTTDLLGKITDEATASLNAVYHKIELAKSVYRLKHTLNR